jgi:hypothetical protein
VAVWNTNGKFDGALDLSAGGLVNVGNFYDLTGSFTISAWVNTTHISAWVNTTHTGGMMPVANHLATFSNGYFLAINHVGDGTGGSGGYAHFYEKYPTSPLSSTSVTDGTWHLLTGVYDQSAGSLAIYVDGAVEGTVLGAAAPSYGNDPFLIGGVAVPGSGPVNHHKGLLDDVRVYDHALSSGEIAALAGSVQSVPDESSSILLLGLGLLSAFGAARRQTFEQMHSSVP